MRAIDKSLQTFLNFVKEIFMSNFPLSLSP